MSPGRIGLLLATAAAAASAPARADSAAALATPHFVDEGPPPCVDDTDVVGFRSCPAFGAWGDDLLAPNVFLELGVDQRHFRAALPSAVARSTSPVTSARDGSAYTLDERIGVGLPLGLYLALDVELGNLESADSPRTPDPQTVFGAFAAAGMQQHLGPIALGAELAAGELSYSYSSDTDLHSEAALEARGRAGLWLSPWCTLGAVVGTSLITHGEWMAGITLGIHSHSYAHP